MTIPAEDIYDDPTPQQVEEARQFWYDYRMWQLNHRNKDELLSPWEAERVNEGRIVGDAE